MNVNVRPNIRQFKKQLNKVHRKQIPYAFFQALNDTAFDAMRDTKKHMRAVFKKPIVPYIPAGIKVLKAKRNKDIDKMLARVDLEDFGDKGQARRDIMKPHIEGGTRRQKKAERLFLSSGRYLYPGRNAARDRYGNLHTAKIVKAISDIGRNVDSGQNTKRKNKKYFAVSTNKQKTIIMQRNGNTVTPFMVEGRKPFYSKRFDFYGAIERSVRQHFNDNMSKRLREAINKPKRK